MNVDLKDVGITLVVGAYALYGSEVILWWASDRNLFRALRKRGIVSETGSVAISLALSFAIGMIMESSTSFVFRDDASPFRSFDAFMLDQVARPDTARGQGPARLHRFTPLGRELAANGLLSSAGSRSTSGSESRWCANGIQPADTKQLKSALRSFYYQAKNVAFGDPERQHELLAIQQRMTFVSAFTLCSTLLALAMIPACVVRRLQEKKKHLYTNTRPASTWIVGSAAMVGLSALALLSWFSYRTESGEYIRRVLGYYSSDVLQVKLSTAAPKLYQHPDCLHEGCVIRNARFGRPQMRRSNARRPQAPVARSETAAAHPLSLDPARAPSCPAAPRRPT